MAISELDSMAPERQPDSVSMDTHVLAYLRSGLAGGVQGDGLFESALDNALPWFEASSLAVGQHRGAVHAKASREVVDSYASAIGGQKVSYLGKSKPPLRLPLLPRFMMALRGWGKVRNPGKSASLVPKVRVRSHNLHH